LAANNQVIILNKTGNNTGNIDTRKILIAQEGFGRDFLKSEIERLIKVLLERQ
jgi:hypothetical protein